MVRFKLGTSTLEKAFLINLHSSMVQFKYSPVVSSANSTGIYIPVWFDLNLINSKTIVDAVNNLHSSMVRFKSLATIYEELVAKNLHSSMVRFKYRKY